MNARELHDWMRNIADTEPDADVLAVTRGFYETILRALDLLARVEESTDELVRELRGIALFLAYRDAFESERTVDKAAAALVALKAERDRLKAHAEAMHNKARRVVNGHEQVAAIEALEAAIDAYRRDFPRTP